MSVCACTGTFITGDPWLVPNETGSKDTFCLLHGALFDIINLVKDQLGDEEGQDLIEAAERIMNGPCGSKAQSGKLLPEPQIEQEPRAEPKPLSDDEEKELRKDLAKYAPYYIQNE